eukprot:gene30460-39705_t
MGKINRASSSKTFVHNKKHNPQARESIERKTIALQNIQIKRLRSNVASQRNNLECYLSTEDKERNAKSISIDRLWDNEEGRQLLHSMLQLGIALHGSTAFGNSKEAVATFQEMMKLDGSDHLLARHQLLRCYLDQGEAGKARQLLDKVPSDSSSCFSFSRALIEHISWTVLHEPAIALNPYTAWTIAYHQIFGEAVDHFELIGAAYQIPPGSVEEALMFLNVDVPLWKETEGAVEWVRSYLCDHGIRPPDVLLSPDDSISNSADEHHAMFLGMFHTAIEMIEEEGSQKESTMADDSKGRRR